MSNFFSKMKDYMLGEGGNLENDGYFDEEIDEVVETTRMKEEPAKKNNVVSMQQPNLHSVPSTGAMKMILFQPLSYEDAQPIVDNLKARKPVIVNMVDLERECAQKVIDFMSGAVYALNGTIHRVSYGIFVIVPSNVSIIGNGDDEDKELFNKG